MTYISHLTSCTVASSSGILKISGNSKSFGYLVLYFGSGRRLPETVNRCLTISPWKRRFRGLEIRRILLDCWKEILPVQSGNPTKNTDATLTTKLKPRFHIDSTQETSKLLCSPFLPESRFREKKMFSLRKSSYI